MDKRNTHDVEHRAGPPVLAMCLSLLLAPLAVWANCGDGRDACEGVADGEPVPRGAETDALILNPEQSYSWEDLLEIVPELRKFRLGYREPNPASPTEDEGEYIVCRKFATTGTRIMRRRCAPLLQYLAHLATQRRVAERTRLAILTRNSTPGRPVGPQ